MLLLGTLLGGSVWAASADIVLNHEDSPDPGPAGGVFTYTLRLENNGPDTATGITLTDVLPPGSEFVGVTTNIGSCTGPAVGSVAPSGVDVQCALPSLAFGGTAMTVLVRVKLPTAGVWRNTATTSAATPDSNTANNTNIFNDTTAVQAADLALTATPSATNLVAGEPFTYTLSSQNLGPNALAAGATQRITFTVPVGAAIVGQPGGGGWACTPASGYPLQSGNIACSQTGAFGVGATSGNLVVNAVANITGTVSAAFAVSATKSDGTVMPDGDSSNNTATVDVTLTAGSDVSITKSTPSTTVAVNDNVTYTLTPRHNGGLPPGTDGSQVITVTDTLPASLGLVATPTGLGWTCLPNSGFPIAGAAVSCTRTGPYTGGNFTNLPAITIATVANSLGNADNTAAIGIPDIDPVPSNNTSNTASIFVSNDADLRLIKTASLNPVVVNQPYTYGLTVHNDGPLGVLAGQTISVTDNLPIGVELTGPATGPGWACTPTAGFPIDGATVNCSRTGALASGADAVVTVPVRRTGAGNIGNTATVALSGLGRVDGNVANDSGSVTIATSTTSADLQITKVASGTVTAGQNLTYIINVTNNGPDTATNVVMTDPLASLINAGGLQSVTTTLGTCTPAAPANGPSQNLSCNLGTMNLGATATITVVVKPTIAATGNRANTASVRSVDIGDLTQGNNSAVANSTVNAIVDLRAGKTATPATVPAGVPITFQSTVTNDGPSDAQTVTITDTLPANAVMIGTPTASNAGVCTAPAAGSVGGTMVCTWTTVQSAGQRTVTYKMRPLGTANGQNVVNSIVVATTTTESNTGNNSATTSTPVTPAELDILVNKIDSVDPVNLGQMTRYTITVNNAGPSYGTHVVMTDVFPDTGSTATATFSYQGNLTVDMGGVCATVPTIGAIAGTLVCTFPGLESGQAAHVSYDMRAETLIVAGATSGTAFNKVNVVVDEPETLMTNNAEVEATTTNRPTIVTDLQLAKIAVGTAFTPGSDAVYILTVTNNGPLASDGAQVTDSLPAGVSFVSAPGCVFVSGAVTCAVGSLANGASRVFTLTVKLVTPYIGTRPLVNTAAVDAPGDPVPGNNSATATTPVNPDPLGAVGIPTLSEWALVLLSVLLGALGWHQVATRRKSK